jgi:hypothetical protein
MAESQIGAECSALMTNVHKDPFAMLNSNARCEAFTPHEAVEVLKFGICSHLL